MNETPMTGAVDHALSRAQLLVMVGGSGVGKSTVARLLQEQLLPVQWLHFSTDTILDCLPASVMGAANGRNDWSRIDVRAIRRTTLSCLVSLLATGNRVIYDSVIMTERGATELVAVLQDYQPLMVALTCSWDETQRRTLARGDRTLEEAARGFETSGHHLAVDRTIDTTDRDPAAVAHDVLDALTECPREAWRTNVQRWVVQDVR